MCHVEGEVELENVHARFTEKAKLTSFGVRGDERAHVRLRHPALAGDAGTWKSAAAGDRCGSSPDAEVVTRSIGTGAPAFSLRAASTLAVTLSISFLLVGPSCVPAEFAAS